MLKRLLIVIVFTIVIIVYFYLHGRMWQIFSPDKFGEVNFVVYTVAGVPMGVLFGLVYFLTVAVLWPIIGGTVNYIFGRDICNVPNYCDDFGDYE